MKENKYFDIPIGTPLIQFTSHLNDSENHRILFNGKFGTGKTYFLKKYFETHTDFKAIHLYPVNYQISSNEDIFELIKYDILLELVKLGWLKNNLEFNNMLVAQSYLMFEGDKILYKILRNIPKLGKAMEVTDNIVSFFSGFKNHKKGINKTNEDIAGEFAHYIENKKGTTYETDLITTIIFDCIKNNSDGKLCLVIDDLDRIDPEHIFRILNIFSAHFDLELEYENKFSFAKVIVVSDIDNIRNIFKAKYGIEADFNGYVDKFYSKAVYNFDNKTRIAKEVRRLLHIYIKRNNIQNTRIINIINEYIMYVLYQMVLAETINFRDLQRLFSNKYDWERIGKLISSNLVSSRPICFDAPYIVDFIFFLFEYDLNKFYDVLDKSKLRCIEDRLNIQIIPELIAFKYHSNLLFKEEEVISSIVDEVSKVKINVQRDYSSQYKYIYRAYVNNLNIDKLNIPNKRLFELLKDVHKIVSSFQDRERIMSS